VRRTGTGFSARTHRRHRPAAPRIALNATLGTASQRGGSRFIRLFFGLERLQFGQNQAPRSTKHEQWTHFICASE
jgi:hypothetical protein